MKKIFAICIIGLFNQLFGGDASNLHLTSFLKNWEVSAGSNYSQFISTPDPGHFGLNLGVYYNSKIYNKLNMKIGFTHSTVNLQARDKIILDNGWSNWKLEYINKIDFTYKIIIFDIFLDYSLIHFGSLSFHPLLGFGYATYNCDGNVKDIQSIEEYDDRTFPEADYNQYFDVVNIADMGGVIHYGVLCKYKNLFIIFNYSNHNNTINEGGAYLKINEKMHNFNTSVGFVF